MTYFNHTTLLTDNRSGDAFGRLRVSEPTTLFDSKLVGIDDAPLYWEEVTVSGAGITASTPTAAKPYVDFTTTLNTAGNFVRQTIRRFVYQPGKGQQVLMTGVLDLSGGGTGVYRRIGLFDDNNGAFFQDSEGTIYVTLRTNDSGSPSDNPVAQANWDDPMDGTGASGITADWTKAQIFVIDFQWLSIGRVRFGLQIDGVLHYVHEISQANSGTIPWASTPNLPLRYQIFTANPSAASTMRCICATVISEGGSQPTGQVRSYGSAAVTAGATDTWYVLAGVEPKDELPGVDIELLETDILLTSASDNVEWGVFYGPDTAITGGSWVDMANSAVEYFSNGGAACALNTSTSFQVSSGYAATGTGAAQPAQGAKGFGAINSLRPGINQSNVQYGYFLAFKEISGTASAVVRGSMTWRETI